MAGCDPLFQLDNQSLALKLQLEDLEAHRTFQSGKWTEDNPPDFAVAFDIFATDLKEAIAAVDDLKLAHSIARAVDSDAVAIEELTTAEAQSLKDRDFALTLNEGETVSSLDAVEFQLMSPPETESVAWDHVIRASEASTWSVASASTIAGPSIAYADRQKVVLEQLPQHKVECSICRDDFYPHATTRLQCGHLYCKACLKAFYLRVTKDETLYPPNCCKKPIDFSFIHSELSAKEIEAYQNAQEEFSSLKRVYCANVTCGKFIPASNRTPDQALCDACNVTTCVYCGALEHVGPCPSDEVREALVKFAETQGWMACYSCGQMVFRSEGCDHITYVQPSNLVRREVLLLTIICISVAGVVLSFVTDVVKNGKIVIAATGEPEMLQRRARQVVEREARQPLAEPIRQQRVRDMEQELRRNHRCNHPGKFTKIEGNSRRGMVCEICGTRHWKYILSCKQCHMLACEDCRRYRLRE